MQDTYIDALVREDCISSELHDGLTGVVIFTASVYDFGQFTANEKYLSTVVTSNFFDCYLTLRLTVKICQFLRLSAKLFWPFCP